MAYTADYSTESGNYSVGRRLGEEMVTIVRYFDTTVHNLANGLYYKIFRVPDNFALLEAFVVCGTVEGAVETCDVVDDDSATTTFVTNADLSTAEGTITATNARKMYTADGYICLKPDADLTACSFYVIIQGLILNTKM